MDNAGAMIEVSHLTRRFAGKVAVDDLSFEVRRGEIVGFLGPNGAGKTTTMRILTGFLPASGGTVRVAGRDVVTDSKEVRRRIGYLPENCPLYPEMRVDEYLRFRAALKGVPARRVRERVTEVVALCGLDEVVRRIVGQLSKGFRQRVGIADALVHDPELLILDEPTIGLDPNQIRQVRDLIRSLADRHTILLSTHILPEVEVTCRRVLIINQGRVIASDTPGNLQNLLNVRPRVTVEAQGPAEEMRAAAAALPGVASATAAALDGGWVSLALETADGAPDLRPEVFRLAGRQGWTIRELHEERRSLEDVFVSLTRPEPAPAAAAAGEPGPGAAPAA